MAACLDAFSPAGPRASQEGPDPAARVERTAEPGACGEEPVDQCLQEPSVTMTSKKGNLFETWSS